MPKANELHFEAEGAADSRATDLRLTHQAVLDETFARGTKGAELKLANGHDASFPVRR